MRPADRFLSRQQELDAEVEEDEHFDVDDEGYEGVRQAPVHGMDLTLSVCLRRMRAVFSVFCVCCACAIAFFYSSHYWTGANLMRARDFACVLIRRGEWGEFQILKHRGRLGSISVPYSSGISLNALLN